MIAADTSTWIAFLEGASGQDSQLLERALRDRQVLMIPVVLTELLSDPALSSGVAETFRDSNERGRAGLLAARRSAAGESIVDGPQSSPGDALIAQICIDRGIALLARDADFRAFADAVRLNLVL
jgi:predicted nucleic acid-binding protein